MGFITCDKSKLEVVAVGGTVLLQETDQRWRGRAGVEEGRGEQEKYCNMQRIHPSS